MASTVKLTGSADSTEQNVKVTKVYEMFDEQCQCPICLRLFIEPVTTLCGHTYCLPCLKQFLQSNETQMYCPMCRENLSYLQNCTIQINSILKNFLETRYENEYIERKLEIEQGRQESERKISVMKKLLIGNHHISAINSEQINFHRWTLFIRFADDENEVNIGNFIKQITINTAPQSSSSDTQTCVLNSAPYRFTAIALEPFAINLDIEFHTKYNKTNLQTDWNLCFTGIGNQKVIDLEFKV
ncbi:unnamed protein product [Didymodactylos carnosus]|uniref:RING-type domain-containing protein n=1 Tax=Didymodactylos carnosus TaxID=1234261 RepID=A0A8S2DXQ0_9BILA|nr:unnamed protein product [Didymodactylos carnosus]CAF3763054.1 unnamed protein product [Didymodactylos carnosus]